MERNLGKTFKSKKKEVVASAVLATAISFSLAGSGNEGLSAKKPKEMSQIPSSEFLPITIYNESPQVSTQKRSLEIVIPYPIEDTSSSNPNPEPTKVPIIERLLDNRPKRLKINVPDVKPKKEITISSKWLHDPEISWYGPGFYGNGTACGQKLTKELKGVAHKTLPCGTLVSFKWKGNEITVPVVDRGPYVSGRKFDLTRGACNVLNHCFTGPIEYKMGK